MLVVSNRFHVREEHVDGFEERFRNRMGRVEESEAFREAHRTPAPGEWFEREGTVEIYEVGFDADAA